MVHVGTRNPLPLNRYLVEIRIPNELWLTRTVFEIGQHSLEWDAEPPGRLSINWGRDWLDSRSSLVAEVPSVVVPEETNVLINPAHDGISGVAFRVVRKWLYDGRLVSNAGK